MNYLKFGNYLLLAALLSIPVFGFLDVMCIRLWDESRLAMNAYEMAQNGNWLVTSYKGLPDMWNTKPPFLIWCQALMIKCFGFNEIAIRLPSALATFFTCVVLVYFTSNYFKSFWFGFIAVIVLITSLGYVNMHSTRFGEYEAMITFFLLASSLCYFLYMENLQPNYLYAFFVLITLAVLTKSIVGLMFLPGLFLYTIWKRKLLDLLKSKHLYVGIGIFFFFAVGYYLLRELFNPGYIRAVYENELGGRFNTAIEGHSQKFSFYFFNIIDSGFVYWCYFLPCAMFVGFFHKDTKIRNLAVFLTVLILTFFFAISFAQTKLEWYDVPLYPFMALMAGIFLFALFSFFGTIDTSAVLKTNIFPFVFLFIIFITPYRNLLAHTYNPSEDKIFYELSYYLQDAVKGKRDLNGQYLLHDVYGAHLDCYIIMLKNKAVQIDRKTMKEVKPGDVVFFTTKQTNCAQYYSYSILHEEGSIITCKILGKK